MGNPKQLTIDEQDHALQLAIAERLGLDPTMVLMPGFRVDGDPSDTVKITWQGYATMPKAELLELVAAHGGQITVEPAL